MCDPLLKYSYSTVLFSEISEQDLVMCSNLFSDYYGTYSGEDGKHAKGQRIRMSPNMYHNTYDSNPNTYVSICKYDNKVVGHVIFILDKLDDGKKFCWVTQLVVNKNFRRNGIGYKLLSSAWCFSDLEIRGLATANAITLKILESVTWRKIDIEHMQNNMPIIEKVLAKVPFMEASNVLLDNNVSQIFSNFYPEPEDSNSDKDLISYTKSFGQINPGCEWFALIFNEQLLQYNSQLLEKYLSFSEENLRDSYDRMDLATQPWARGAREEIVWLDNYFHGIGNNSKEIIRSDSAILDLGCGVGRHSIELALRKYTNIEGIDFAESQIKKAIESASSNGVTVNFYLQDARYYLCDKKYDLILCLYDVIGSFRDEKDNEKIISTIRKLLNPNGYAVISVMNLEATQFSTYEKVSLSTFPEAILRLKPSNAMAKDGEVLDNTCILNTDDGLVYRKEQFSMPGKIFAEYLIASKRYTKKGIEDLLNKNGLKVVKSFYARAGQWKKSETNNDPSLKEIVCIVQRKKSIPFFDA